MQQPEILHPANTSRPTIPPAKDKRVVLIRGVQLIFEDEYSDLDLIPLQRLTDGLFGESAISMTELNACQLQGWKSLECIFGKTLPEQWFNADQCRIKLHAAEILAIAQSINQDLLAKQSYTDAQSLGESILNSPEASGQDSSEGTDEMAEAEKRLKIETLEKELTALKQLAA